MTQFIEKISALAKEFADPELDRQVQEIKMIDECVSRQRMLLFAPDRLGISDDRFAELTWELPDSQIKGFKQPAEQCPPVPVPGIWDLVTAKHGDGPAF